jgi:hypothetical protein
MRLREELIRLADMEWTGELSGEEAELMTDSGPVGPRFTGVMGRERSCGVSPPGCDDRDGEGHDMEVDADMLDRWLLLPARWFASYSLL